MKLYLAHPLELRKQIREVELEIEGATGIELLNPFYDTGRDDIYKIDRGEIIRSAPDLDFRAIVEKDLGNIAKCDGLIAYIERGIYSLGTLFETWNTMLVYEDKIIYIVSPDSLMHPWIRYILDQTGGQGYPSWDGFKQEMYELKAFELEMEK